MPTTPRSHHPTPENHPQSRPRPPIAAPVPRKRVRPAPRQRPGRPPHAVPSVYPRLMNSAREHPGYPVPQARPRQRHKTVLRSRKSIAAVELPRQPPKDFGRSWNLPPRRGSHLVAPPPFLVSSGKASKPRPVPWPGFLFGGTTSCRTHARLRFVQSRPEPFYFFFGM